MICLEELHAGAKYSEYAYSWVNLKTKWTTESSVAGEKGDSPFDDEDDGGDDDDDDHDDDDNDDDDDDDIDDMKNFWTARKFSKN